jgi:hypothetical protein
MERVLSVKGTDTLNSNKYCLLFKSIYIKDWLKPVSRNAQKGLLLLKI